MFKSARTYQRFVRYLLVFSLGCLLAATHPAGAAGAASAEPAQAEKNDKLQRSDWKELAPKHYYGEEEQPEPKEEEAEFEIEPPKTWKWFNSRSVATIILSIIVVALLIIAIYLILRNADLKDQKVASTNFEGYTLEELDATMPESDLERYLRIALENEDFKAAVRVYYLILLNRLNELGAIDWEPEKTNNDYAVELSGHPSEKAFKHLTLIYEVIWYGEAEINESEFKEVEPRFKNALSALTNG